jgi:hypothetical protein
LEDALPLDQCRNFKYYLRNLIANTERNVQKRNRQLRSDCGSLKTQKKGKYRPDNSHLNDSIPITQQGNQSRLQNEHQWQNHLKPHSIFNKPGSCATNQPERPFESEGKSLENKLSEAISLQIL